MADVLPLRLRPAVVDPSTDATDLPLVVDARRLAPMLCAHIRTVRSWDAAGKLPTPLRIGGRVVWRLAEIREWLAAGAPDRVSWERMKASGKN